MDLSDFPDCDWIAQVPELKEFAQFLKKVLALLVPLSKEENELYLSLQSQLSDQDLKAKSQMIYERISDNNFGRTPDTEYYLKQGIRELESKLSKYETILANQIDTKDITADMELSSRQISAKINVQRASLQETEKDLFRLSDILVRTTPTKIHVMDQISCVQLQKEWYVRFKNTVDELIKDCPELGDETLFNLNCNVEMQRLELEATKIYIKSIVGHSLGLESNMKPVVNIDLFKSALSVRLRKMRPTVEKSVRDRLVKPHMLKMFENQVQVQNRVISQLHNKLQSMQKVNTGLAANLSVFQAKAQELHAARSNIVASCEAIDQFVESVSPILKAMKENSKLNPNFIPQDFLPVLDLFEIKPSKKLYHVDSLIVKVEEILQKRQRLKDLITAQNSQILELNEELTRLHRIEFMVKTR